MPPAIAERSEPESALQPDSQSHTASDFRSPSRNCSTRSTRPRLTQQWHAARARKALHPRPLSRHLPSHLTATTCEGRGSSQHPLVRASASATGKRGCLPPHTDAGWGRRALRANGRTGGRSAGAGHAHRARGFDSALVDEDAAADAQHLLHCIEQAPV